MSRRGRYLHTNHTQRMSSSSGLLVMNLSSVVNQPEQLELAITVYTLSLAHTLMTHMHFLSCQLGFV